MKTLVLQEPGRLDLTDCPSLDAIGAGEALVKVHRIGVCGTDIHAFGGKQPFFTYPRIPGHELGVEILEVGPNDRGLKPGNRCSVEPYLNCGHCIACRRGRPNACVSLRVLGVHADGGMREMCTVPANKLHPSDSLSYEQLALVEPLGIGAHAVDRAGLEPGEFALVIGAGPIGLAVMQFALEAGAQVIVLDINSARLESCQKLLGVRHVIHALEENPLESLQTSTSGDLPTAVFDATGNAKSMMAAFQYAAPGGRLVFVGLFQGDLTFNDPDFHRRELTVMGSRNAVGGDFTRIIRLMESGRIDPTRWITHRARLADVPVHFPAWTNPETGVIKAMIAV